jgi:epoxyqueuosine reductase
VSIDRNLARQVKSQGLALGFDLIGVAEAVPGEDTRFLRSWLARGFAGRMEYLERRVEERVDPRLVLPGVRSAVVVGLVHAERHRAVPDGTARGQVASYAGGDDYHEVLRDRLRALEQRIGALAGRPVKSRAYVDTGPVQERALAARAGLGWIGKNTCLIHPRLGSTLLLGVVLCDLELEPDRPEPDHCGTCRACLDACPTEAFPEPGVLDATRCISYTRPIAEELRAAHGDQLFGCDLCQEVCPWNTRPKRRTPSDPLGLRARLAQREPWREPSVEWVLGLDEQSWREATRRTALRRARHRGLLRNALVVAGNAGDPKLRSAVERHATGGDALLADHARWALGRL